MAKDDVKFSGVLVFVVLVVVSAKPEISNISIPCPLKCAFKCKVIPGQNIICIAGCLKNCTNSTSGANLSSDPGMSKCIPKCALKCQLAPGKGVLCIADCLNKCGGQAVDAVSNCPSVCADISCKKFSSASDISCKKFSPTSDLSKMEGCVGSYYDYYSDHQKNG